MNRLSQQAQALNMHKLLHIYDQNTGKKLTLRALLQNPETTKMWSKSASNEYGRLLKGNKYGVTGIDTTFFCHQQWQNQST